MQKAESEQVELRPAVHAAFQELELVDLALGLAVAPGLGQASVHRDPVPAQPSRKALQFGYSTVRRLGQPRLEGRPVELFIKTSRGDLDTLPDSGIDDISVQVKYRASWLLPS